MDRGPGSESGAVETMKTVRRAKPEIAVGVLRNGEDIAGRLALLDRPDGEAVVGRGCLATSRRGGRREKRDAARQDEYTERNERRGRLQAA